MAISSDASSFFRNGNIYVHNRLSVGEMKEIASEFNRYKDFTNRKVMEVTGKVYSDRIKELFNNNDKSREEYFRLARLLVNNSEFEKVLNSSLNELYKNKYSGGGVPKNLSADTVRKYIKEYQDKIDDMKNAVLNLTSILGISGIEQSLGVDNTKEVISAIERMTKEKGFAKDRIITLENYKKMSESFQGQYRALLKNIASFYQSDLNDVRGTTEIINKILIPVQTLSGIAYELLIEKNFAELMKGFKLDWQGTPIAIEVKRVGDDRNDDSLNSFRVGTTDLSFNFTDGEGHILFGLPNFGASVKRSIKGIKNNGKFNINLKTSTLGKLLSAAEEMNGNAFSPYFYNFYASEDVAKFKNGKEVSVAGASNIKDSLMALKAQILLPSLVGNLTSNDMLSLFIINEKAYTIFDLLSGLSQSKTGRLGLSGLGGKSRTGVQAKNKPTFKTAIQRSDYLLYMMKKITLNISIKFHLSEIGDFI